MAMSEVLLLVPIPGLGAEGETVKVRSGYARNRLLPLNLALPLNRANKKQIEALLKAREAREEKEHEGARDIATKLEKISIAIPVKTGKSGKMFGAVTVVDVLARLNEEGLNIDKKKASLAAPIKSLGKHTLRMKLHPKVTIDFQFEVVSENPIKEVE